MFLLAPNTKCGRATHGRLVLVAEPSVVDWTFSPNAGAGSLEACPKLNVAQSEAGVGAAMGWSLDAEGAGELECPGPNAGCPPGIAGCSKIAQPITTWFQHLDTFSLMTNSQLDLIRCLERLTI